ncbi:hypothetical protein [Butyrivibrio sp. XBB1001]|uniref:hypothetical protein n=1 Tax=Butyrivibrio sp. XBB1001 TaxID=1280682 RepID=UPI00040567EF|nr:hypothetical protein [Butyrivibrio sp. XBB1001]
MALFNCPECGNRISDKADRCPHCGVDMKTIKVLLAKKDSVASSQNNDEKNKLNSILSQPGQESISENNTVPYGNNSNGETTHTHRSIDKKKMATMLIVVAVVAVLIAGAFLLSYARRPEVAKRIYGKVGICMAHNYQPPTCVLPYVCSICGKEKGVPLDHDYQMISSKDPSCTDKGEKIYKCTRCSDQKITEEEALGHVFSGDQEVVDATCEENGRRISKCSRCGELIEETIPAKGHDLTEATCTTPAQCKNCGKSVGNALGHTTINGVCDRCGEYVSEPIEYSGKGDSVISHVSIPEGLYQVYFTNAGKSNFIIHFYDDNGSSDGWMNVIGDFTGYIITEGPVNDGMIEVKSSGDWTITIEQIRNNGTSNIQGTGYCVTPYFELDEGNLTIDINYKGSSNFITHMYDEDGNRYGITNEIGDYSGQKVFSKGKKGKKYCLVVKSYGEWSINFGLTDKVTYISNSK